jgi:O-antigen/teichoic acid export membrane protein
MTVIGIFLSIWGHAFINLWVGERNFAGMDVLVLLIILNFFHALGTPAVALLQGIGNNKAITYSEVVCAVLNLMLSILLVRKAGLSGIVIAVLVAHVCTSFWVAQYSVLRCIRLSLREYISTCILPPLLPGIILGALIWFVAGNVFPGGNFFYLALNGFIVVLICGCVFAVFGIWKKEWFQYLSLFEKPQQ